MYSMMKMDEEESDSTHQSMRSTARFDTGMEVEDDVNDKENHPGALVSGKDETTLKRDRSRKDDLAKVRKSLAWNKAFFTEDGVLDSMELSLLNGPLEKSDGSLLLRKNEGMLASPFSSSKKVRGNVSKLQSIEEISGIGSQARSRNKVRKPGGLLSDANSLTCGRPPPHPIHGITQKKGKILEDKTTCKSSQRPPSSNSQKRISNSCVVNPASKIPKLKGGNSSLSKSAKKVSQASSTSNITQTVQPCPILHPDVISFLFSTQAGTTKITYLHLPCTFFSFAVNIQTDKQHDKARAKTTLQKKSSKHNSDLAFPPKPSQLTNLTPSYDSFKNNINKADMAENVCLVPSLNYSAKPSALRKPSPSLGFFLQGNNSKLDTVGELRTSHIADGQIRSTKGLDATSTSSSSSIPTCMNVPVKPSTGSRLLKRSIIAQSPVRKNSEMEAEMRIKHVLDGIYTKEFKPANSSRASGISCSMNRDVKPSTDPGSLTDSPSNGNFKNQLSVDDVHFKKAEKHIMDFSESVSSNGHFDLSKANARGSEMGDFSTEKFNSQCHANDEEMTNLGIAPSKSDCKIGAIDIPYSSGVIMPYQDEVVPEKERSHVTPQLTEGKCAVLSSRKEDVDHIPICENIYNSISQNNNGDLRSSVADDIRDISASKADLAYCEKTHETMNTVSSEEVVITTRDDQSTRISKGKPLPLQCQLKAEPFTDEWIAAVEAFGEDILKRKGGAVQNSPTDKTLPEPSPWSPVKRKNQDVGPYDCTKYTKLPSSSGHA